MTITLPLCAEKNFRSLAPTPANASVAVIEILRE
jgi:hypothetical protein